MKYKIINIMKNKQITTILIYIFLIICQSIYAQDIDENETDEELVRIRKLMERGEQWRAEQQAKILTLNDLEFTYWEAEEEVGIIGCNFAFLNENHVLLIKTSTRTPYSLIQYSIRGNMIFFNEIMTGYLYDTYLFIGVENEGYVKFRLEDTFYYSKVLQKEYNNDR